MVSFTLSLLALTLSSLCSASIDNNINYLSPSRRHTQLGISKPLVHKRHATLISRESASSGKEEYFPADKLSFTHGVASGDPYADSTILWTRVAPEGDAHGNARRDLSHDGLMAVYSRELNSAVHVSTKKVCVDYAVATDEKMKNVVDKGTAHTTSDVDYTVKVEAKNLKPWTTYYYQFSICGSSKASPVGRTKTLPADDKFEDVRLAVYSCNNLPFGFFNAIAAPVRKDSVDYVVHLGDYIYEYRNGDYGNGTDIGRVPQPDKDHLSTLRDFRTRLAQYRADEDLNESHRRFAWITTWDDHEVSDNTWKDGASDMFNDEASFIRYGNVSFQAVKANAVRAYFEWMPLRQVDMDDYLRIWRDFKIGKTLDLLMLDTRLYDRDITDVYTNRAYIDAIKDEESRSLMGPKQEAWFYKKLSESSNRGAAWHIVGSQVYFSPIDMVLTDEKHEFELDTWDAYRANRNRTLNHLYSHNISNTIVIAGDSHASYVSDLVWLDREPYDNQSGEGAIGVEFAGSAVSSPPPTPECKNGDVAHCNRQADTVIGLNPELQWNELKWRGYFELSLTPEKATARYYGFKDIRTRDSPEILLAEFEVENGANKLKRYDNGSGKQTVVKGGVVKNGSLRNGRVVP